MPATRKVVREYARYYAFAFNLNIARPVFERAPDWTVVTGGTTVLPRRLNRAAAACPDQGTYQDRSDVDPFDSQCISQLCLRVTAKLYLNQGIVSALNSRPATQWV